MLKHTPLRQSTAWANFLQKQGWNIKKEKSESGNVLIFVRKLPFFGSVIKVQRQKNPLPINTIEKIAKENKAVRIIVEPYKNFGQEKELYTRGYSISTEPLLPPKTTLIDLTQNEDEILSQMHYSGRRGIRNAKKKGVDIRKEEITDKNLKLLSQTLGNTAKRGNFKAIKFQTLKEKAAAFGNDANLFIAYKNSNFLGAVLALSAEETLHYHHAATSKLGRQTSAAYLLVWKAMLWGKKNNFATFDFGGIADSRFPHTKSWEGFTEFKNKFGGKKTEWPAPLIKWRLPF